MSKRSEPADVCLVLEGTYPYVSGGVSTWVHQTIAALPDLKFSIFFIGAEKSQALEEKYEIPDNVVSVDKMFLFDELPRRDRQPSKKPPSTRVDVYGALGDFLERVSEPGEHDRFGELATAVQRSGRNMACANLWTDQAAAQWWSGADVTSPDHVL